MKGNPQNVLTITDISYTQRFLILCDIKSSRKCNVPHKNQAIIDALYNKPLISIQEEFKISGLIKGRISNARAACR